MWTPDALPSVVPKPYPHIRGSGIMSPEGAEGILKWLNSCEHWKTSKGAFFEQYSFVVEPQTIDGGLGWVFSARGLLRLREAFEKTFNRPLANRFRVVAHNLEKGQGIGIHNDAPHLGLETTRLITYVSTGFHDENGGHLLLLNGNQFEDLADVVRPLHGTYVAFPLSEKSYHAVSEVEKGPRFSFIVSFWDADLRNSEELEAPAEGIVRFAEQTILPVLRSAGASEAEHTGRSLLEHLQRTFNLLVSWDCSPTVSISGLLHSAFGTEGRRSLPMGQEERSHLKATVGGRCARYVDLYSRMVRSTLYSNNIGDDPFHVVTSRDGSVEVLSDSEWLDLLIVDVANSVDQLLSGTLPASVQKEIKIELEHVESHLPKAVRQSDAFSRAMVGALV